MAGDLEAVKQAAEDVRKAEADLAQARERLRLEIAKAVAEGSTYSAVARAAGVSRQWVATIVREEGTP